MAQTGRGQWSSLICQPYFGADLLYNISMADADSLHEANSDLENDHSAGDADVEDDEAVNAR